MSVYVMTWIAAILLNSIESWSPVCPRKCSCQNRPVSVALISEPMTLKTVDCNSRNLIRIPSDLPVETEALLVGNNSIRMHVGIHLMPQLRVLDLTRNRIQGFFGRLQLPHLEHLDLSYNVISRVSSSDNDVFAPLRNLRTLNLRGNIISVIHAETLKLPRLINLDMAENRLSSVDDRVLHSLHQLEKVDFSDNQISDEAFGNVFTLMHLESVNLSRNHMDVFTTRDFTVDQLDLSRNAFSTLNRQTLTGFQARVLNLSGLPNLWSVSASAFDKMDSLSVLDLSRNGNLTYIEQETFNTLPNLTSLNLDDTGLVKLPGDVMRIERVYVTLRNVPLSCYLNSELVKTLSYRNLTCRWRNETLDVTQLETIKNTTEWINALPIILPTFPPAMEADVGTVLELQCQAAGNVTGIDWFKLDDRRKREQALPSRYGVLRIEPLYRVHSGRYCCRAHNDFGSVNRTITISVTYAPVVIILLEVTTQYVRFAWNNSDLSLAPRFRIQYYESIAGNFSHVRTISVEHLVRTHTISGLKSGTLYKICLLLNKTGTFEEMDCKNITTLHPENVGSRVFQSVRELIIAIACIFSLLFMIFMSTCVYRFYQEKKEDTMAESLSRILLSDSSCTASEAATPTTYFNPGIDPLTPTTDLDIRAAFLPEHHPYRNPPLLYQEQMDSQMQSTQF